MKIDTESGNDHVGNESLPSRVRYQLLEVFRGISIIWIICFHILADDRDHYGSFLSNIIGHGWLGISIFFVISGFGIGVSLDNWSRKGEPKVRYLLRRLQRIYFPYWWHLFFITIVLPISAAFFSMLKSHNYKVEFFQYTFSEWFEIALLLKVFSATDWHLNLAFLPINGVVWYIAVIVQIYFFITFSLICGKLKNIVIFLGFLLSLLTYIPSVYALIPVGFFLPYFSECYLGFLVYQLIDKKIIFKRGICIGTISLLLILCFFTVHFSRLFSLNFAILFASVCWGLHPYDKSLSLYSLFQFFGLIGTFSYSCYLLHVPLWPIINMFIRNLVPLPGYVADPLLLIPLIVGFSFLWFLFFENPGNPSKTIKALMNPYHTVRTSLNHLLGKAQ